MAPEPSSQHSTTPEPDAEQLLKVLDLQLRQKRSHAMQSRTTSARVWSLVLLVLVTMIALLVLQFMLTQLRQDNEPLIQPNRSAELG